MCFCLPCLDYLPSTVSLSPPKTSCNIPRIQSLVTTPQIDSAVPVHAGRSGGDDEVVRAQRGVRAAGHGPRDVPAVLVAQPAVYQHALPSRTDGRIPT